jgi:hypothetical protein
MSSTDLDQSWEMIILFRSKLHFMRQLGQYQKMILVLHLTTKRLPKSVKYTKGIHVFTSSIGSSAVLIVVRTGWPIHAR